MVTRNVYEFIGDYIMGYLIPPFHFSAPSF